MARPGLSTEELTWLTREPPRDEQNRLVPWSLRDRSVREASWSRAIEHADLILYQVDFNSVRWQGAVFRHCVLSDVEISDASFVHVHFEDVVFQRCQFLRSTFESCEFLRCHWDDCRIEFITVLRGGFGDCLLTQVGVCVFNLRECDLSGTRFDMCQVEGLRASRIKASTLEFFGGRVLSADLTVCNIAVLILQGVAVEGLHLLNLKMERASLSDAAIQDLILASCTLGTLSVTQCSELFAWRVLRSTISSCQIEHCPMIVGLLIADSHVRTLLGRVVGFQHVAFERINAAGCWRFEGAELGGVVFVEGVWARLELNATQLTEYIVVRGTRIASLDLASLSIVEPFDLRLVDEHYGEGSLKWSDVYEV